MPKFRPHTLTASPNVKAKAFHAVSAASADDMPKYSQPPATAVQRKRATGKGNICWPASTSFGTADDTAQAIAWYEKSAAQGYGYAACNLACIYADGEGVVADPVLVEHYRRLAHQHLTDDAELAELDALVQRTCG